VLVSGSVMVFTGGGKRLTTIKRWDSATGKYVELTPEEQKREDDENEWRAQMFPYYGSHSLIEELGDGKISYEASGTGETIGHIADLEIKNLVKETLEVLIPPGVLESK